MEYDERKGVYLMKVNKDDILYRYSWIDASDKDYCTPEIDEAADRDLECRDPEGNECPNYKKCFCKPQRLELTKVTITKKTFWPWDKTLKHYNAVNLKHWKKSVGNFKNSSFKINEKIRPSDINEWSKSESAALSKVKFRLDAYIRKIEKAKDTYFARKQVHLPALRSLQKRINKKMEE